MGSKREIRRALARRSRIHGQGLFATEDIPEEEKIIEYTGERITKAEGDRRYKEQARAGKIYLFELNSRHDIDGSSKGNIAKYANHSCEPNAETTIEKGKIWILALRDIKKGEEITFDYNLPLYDYEKRPCKCGTKKCRGWIINRDSHYYLRRKQGKSAKKAVRKRAGKTAGKAAGKAVKKRSRKAAAKRGRKTGKKRGKRTGKKGGKKAAKRGVRRGRKAR